MTTPSLRRFLSSASLSFALLVASTALAKTVQVGTCLPSLQTYATISLAVAAVQPSSTIMVCPGNYPEQVTITQPLTLKGVQLGNRANPTVVAPPGGLTQSVIAPTNGISMFFQILVQGTGAGLVDISDIGVNGSNNNVSSGWMQGIYFQNSSGTLKNVATYNQTGNGYGFGIFLESTTTTQKTISISDSSVHDFDAEGIRSNANTNPPTLTVNIESNAVLVTPAANLQVDAINIDGVGVIRNNSIATKPGGPGSAGIGIAALSGLTIAQNTIAGMGIGIWTLGNSDNLFSNKVSYAEQAILISGTANDVEHNLLLGANPNSGAGIGFNCTGTGNTVIHNVVNDAFWGLFDTQSGNTTSPNTFTNVANISSGSC
jgi:hypothetical protein